MKQNRPNIQVYATIWQRLLALTVDLVVVTAPLAVISFLVFGNWRGDWVTIAIEVLYWLAVPVLTRGYTIGKWMAGIRIEMRKGSPPGYFCTLLRYGVVPFFYVVSFGGLLLVSIGMMVLRTDRKSLHDLVANTVVVKGNSPKYVPKQSQISA
ncbi:RDD family protein [Pseudalkalibacillus berkeleyi]|uniref:RDD family protein n=1 Tax=Pseudalkalibacillus berkeleyi TaxID=1069813 RepID=A0ABS9H4Q6_9BACL|nr:RDD family protein [Pseudalkalibacillus berkeleyi]MCF6138945.1 RDD family protein [Pseudalkalibacillus berkeleyi]